MVRADFVVFTGPRQVEWVSRDLDGPQPGQVLLRTTRTVISTGTELAGLTGPPWLRTDGTGLDPIYPQQTGYCLAGVVESVGDRVTWPRPGDRVACHAPHGTHALVAAAACHAIPEGLADETAALTAGLGATVLNGCRIGRPGVGEEVVVLGQGLIGQMATLVLGLSGLRCLIAVDVSEQRLDAARRLGAATHCVNPAKTDLQAALLELTAGRRADVVFEATGRGESFDACIGMARRFGTVVALGSPRWPAAVNLFHLHEKGVRIVGAHISTHPKDGDEQDRWSRRANVELLLEWGARGRVRFGDLIGHRYPRDRAPQAFADLVAARDRFLGVALEW